MPRLFRPFFRFSLSACVNFKPRLSMLLGVKGALLRDCVVDADILGIVVEDNHNDTLYVRMTYARDTACEQMNWHG